MPYRSKEDARANKRAYYLKRKALLGATAAHASQRAWNLRHPHTLRDIGLRSRLRKIGVDPSTVSPRPEKCELCEQPGRMCVDHCHERLVFRGWLCHRCNAGLGHFKDNPALLLKAAQYLRGNNYGR